MRTHTLRGGEVVRNILGGLEDPDFLNTAQEIAESHHEKWDGSGYPRGLRGEEIPLPARIMAATDVFDALVSKRVYKDAIAPEAAIDHIVAESGRHFDPEIARAVSAIRDELIAAANSPLGEME